MEKIIKLLKLLLVISCVFLVLAPSSFCKKDKDNLYDLNNSAVMNLNDKNFNNQITFNRSKDIVSIVHYYKMNGKLNHSIYNK